MKALALVALIYAAAGCSALTPPPPTAIPPAVRLDTSAARGLLDFLEALGRGQPWDEGRIRQLVASPPYEAMVAHHHSLDPEVTADALLQMLFAVRDGQRFAGPSPRITRMFATYRWALGETPLLRARLARLADPAALQKAVERAQAALPGQARLQATVYVLADGCSPAYLTGDAIVLDLLQIGDSAGIDRALAHELHHIGVNSLQPASCGDVAMGRTLDTLAGLVQEGAATYWIDGWRAQPQATDYEQVDSFLHDALAGGLSREEARKRLAQLLGPERGPLYTVGNGLIARLAKARGNAWVQANLGDPVGLLQACYDAGGWPSAQGVLEELRKGCPKCPDWCRSPG